MKHVLLFFFSLLSFYSLAQEKATPQIKIYLEDAETGKNIDDAKVTLEGFEIPAITAKYDQKNNYYYFNEIPSGYNTVMSYHKKYNEKGYQNVAGLPKELKLRLYDPHYVSYSFEKPKLTEFKKDYSEQDNYLKILQNKISKGNSIENKNFRYLYNEDLFHVAIITKYSYKDFFSNDTIKRLLNKLSLEYTKYKSGTEERYTLNAYQFNDTRLSKYQYLENDIQQSENQNYPGLNNYNVCFFNKIDKTKFNRFNCKEIQELRKFNFVVATLSNRVIEYYANSKFNKKSFKELYDHNIKNNIYQNSIDNYDFGKLKIPEKIFFKSSEKESKMYFGEEKSRKLEVLNSDYFIETIFFVIPKNQNSSKGLGTLDDDSVNETNFKNRFYFFNTLSGNYLKIIK
ncbi:hypothetical protein LNQ49_21245 [Flavobacterium sp. F-65]|uniref:Carboxypeptidase regulatory-like domain-containing protein n=1 Tax=Flavobacterium pisciphilum TaxID=2893755 RepID=A0ABS8MZC2_9FLAO|nr:hypothetical protein [Flavobacterium sp. F-65]MCC9074118.1 hypothetical protein [Flavobacterium sp. F-65]